MTPREFLAHLGLLAACSGLGFVVLLAMLEPIQ